MGDRNQEAGQSELTGAEFEALQQALMSAFPTPDKLRQMVRRKLNRNLDAFTDGPLEKRAFELVEAAESEGWTRELIEGARAENKGSPALKHFRLDYLGSVQRCLSKGELERIVRASGQFEDIVAWREKLAQIELQVCRLELPSRPVGTGFLVADDVVLTNYHVVEGQDVSMMSARFDHKVLADGTTINSGHVCKVAGPVIDQSPYSPFDLTYPRQGLPTTAELDYALLRLDSKPGGDIVAGKRRGVIKPPVGAVPTEGLIFIVQHPLGRPLQIAFDAILNVNKNLTRISYKVDTEGGSSGSPVFDRNWGLIALHHGGDPRMHQQAEFNEGIPIDTIRKNLKPDVKAAIGWA